MSIEILDLTNYRNRNGAKVPEGNYLVQVEEVEVGKSPNKGTRQWTVYLRIIGGDQDGQMLVDRLYITENALFRVVGFLNGIGVKTSNKKMRISPAKLAGRKARVDVADGEPYNGTVRSEIKSYQRFVSAKTEASEDVDELEDQLDEGDDLAAESEDVAEQEPKKKSKTSSEEEDYGDDTVDDSDIDLDDIDV